MMIKAIIFDIGGVIQGLDWSPIVNSIIDIKPGLDIDTYRDAFYYDRENYFNKYSTGELSKEEFWGMVCSKLGLENKYFERLSKSSELLYSFINSKLIELIKELRNNYDLFILANSFQEIETKVIKDNIYTYFFDGIYFSHNIRYRKPNKESFMYVLNDNGLKPEECIFVDNDIRNVNGAKKVGLNAILYKGMGSLKEEIYNICKKKQLGGKKK